MAVEPAVALRLTLLVLRFNVVEAAVIVRVTGMVSGLLDAPVAVILIEP